MYVDRSGPGVDVNPDDVPAASALAVVGASGDVQWPNAGGPDATATAAHNAMTKDHRARKRMTITS